MQNLIGTISGMSVYSSVHATQKRQTMFPRSKKKRIQKKWRKDQRNWDERPAAYMVSGKLIAHPAYIQELQKRVGVIRQ